jgi:TPP-dependent pyruvate/acetoin dehydrogenase alpha subunit
MKKLTKKQLLQLYRNLVRTRKYDELNIKMAFEGKLMTFYHSCEGHEAIGVGACTFLRKDDYLYIHIRGHGLPYAIGKGIDPKACIAEHLGKATGWGCGITGIHMADVEHGVLAVGGTIGSAFPLSAGYALAAKKRGKGQVAICFVGDGSMQRGQAHEAMNMAACWKLPVIWVVENNQMAWFTPFSDTCPLEDIADMAQSYNMPGQVVDGMDVEAVYEAVQAAVDRARAGEGPSLVECKTYRFRAHSEGRPDVSHFEPRPKEEIEKWKKRDPVNLFRKKLLKRSVLTKKLIGEIDREYEAEIVETEQWAIESPYPDPSILSKIVYAP